MRSKPKKAFYRNALQQSGGALSSLLENAQMFEALLELGRQELPTPLNQHLIGTFFEGNTLFLQIDEGVWATQLRFYEPTVLAVFQHNLPHLELTRVKVQVIPKIQEPKKPRRTMRPLSRQNALQMRELSEHIDSPKLRDALQKLSQCQQDHLNN